MKTYVFELWEQLGGRLPATLVLPVGNGTLVLGAYLGCRDLLDQGLIGRRADPGRRPQQRRTQSQTPGSLGGLSVKRRLTG
jgi:hypothetical protein